MTQENDFLAEYTVKLAPDVFRQIEQIKIYMTTVLLAPEAAVKRVEKIFDDLENLKRFPERGFDANKTFGKEIYQNEKTRGIPVADGKYLMFYVLDEIERVVFVHHFVPSESDYMRLFGS